MANERYISTAEMIPGYKGKLYDGDGILLLEVDNFEAILNITNIKLQTMGTCYERGKFMNWGCMLSWEEFVLRDETRIGLIIASLKQGIEYVAHFRGELEGKTYEFRNWIPDGAISLIGCRPNELVKRPWSGIVNDPPDLSALI
jgi:hypothetical protein